MNSESSLSPLVCVTGGSGFVAGHVICELLKRGFRVRATVRDLSIEDKVGHLTKMAAQSGGSLELFEADLLVERSFDAPFSNCDFIIHVAAVAKLAAADPMRDIVTPSIQGTQNVLDTIVRVGGVKRYIHTSSVAAVLPTHSKNEELYDERSWNEDATLKNNPYGLAKTGAEKLVWDFIDSLEDGKKFEAVAINPVLVVGPVLAKRHLRASPMVIHDLLVGKFPACPQFSFGIVDVREVAFAHAEALVLEKPERRFLLCNQSRWMVEIGQELAKLYPQFKIPTAKLPNFIMYFMAIFDKRLSFANLRSLLGKSTRIDNRRSIDRLKVNYRPIEETLKDCCDSMLEPGFANPKSR
ncbi:MAG: NAD-dependent epimerase/dehydratase family protein [Planctomycetota bacterium]|nr:NAD-dependent epimerase/dehydratase family protein [Planctomycetota bacterium]